MYDSVSLQDYQNFGEGFGVTSGADVAQLNKALNTGDYSQAGDYSGRTGGSPLIVESLENSLKVLTYTDKHVKLWKKIPKTPAYSTVEEYNQLLSYGSDGGGFMMEGGLPDTQDSEYKRNAAFVKFIGTTREITHPMTLVRTAHGDVIARENQNGILWMMKKVENALFWGDSSLAADGKEGLQFDGLDRLIDKKNTIDIKGKDLADTDINLAAQLIIDNYGTPTDLFLPFETLSTFSQQYFPKERVIMPTQEGGYAAGLVVNHFQTHGGSVGFEPDLFLRKTEPLPERPTGGLKSPTAPASIAVVVDNTVTNGDFTKSGAGTYKYYATAVNASGESMPCAAVTLALTSDDLEKGVKFTITNSAAMAVAPDYYNVYRTEVDGNAAYRIMSVPCTSAAAGAATIGVDVNFRMPNTYTAFMGEFSPDIFTFRQLAPIMKMDLAVLSASQRWMILLYGTPVLFAPRKWCRIMNIKSSNARA